MTHPSKAYNPYLRRNTQHIIHTTYTKVETQWVDIRQIYNITQIPFLGPTSRFLLICKNTIKIWSSTHHPLVSLDKKPNAFIPSSRLGRVWWWPDVPDLLFIVIVLGARIKGNPVKIFTLVLKAVFWVSGSDIQTGWKSILVELSQFASTWCE